MKKINYSKGKHILDFSAYSFCKPCIKIKPVFHELEKEFPDIKFHVVETDKDDEESEILSRKFNISSIPAFFFIKDGEIINKFVGGDEKRLVKFTEELNDM
jgi:suppressor of tumorigenicity protein 13